MKKILAAVLLAICSVFAHAQNIQTFTFTSTGSPCAVIKTQNNSTVGIIASGTGSGMTLTPTLLISQVASSPTATAYVTPTAVNSVDQATITANGSYRAKVAGFAAFQLCPTAFTSGTETITLFSTPALFASSGSGVLQPSSTVGTSGIWAHSSAELSYVGNSTTVTPTSGTMFYEALYPTFSQTIGHFTINVGTAGTAETFFVCIYNAAGTSLLWSASAAVNSIATVSGSAAQVTLPPIPGGYLVAWAQTGTAGAVVQGYAASGPTTSILNQNGNRTGTTANLPGGSCPATTGTLTPQTSNVYPLIALEP